MIDRENTPPEYKKQEEKKILSGEIRDYLNELRTKNKSFHEKAENFASFLKKSGCQEINIIECDVCASDFCSNYDEILYTNIPDNFDNLNPTEKEKNFQKIDGLIPDEAKTRVQAETSFGQFTYCFNCDSTMCMNEVEYPENPKWDEIHREEAKKY